MQRLLNRVYYFTETLLTRSPGYQLMLVALVIGMLSLGCGVLVHLTNPSAFSDTPAAVWWAFLRLTDPGYLGEDKGVAPRLISTFLTLAGYVVFLGALVAIMTNWLDRLMAFLASGRSPIFEEGHVLIIGWNERIHALIEEVVHTAQQLIGNEVKPAIVILCEPYDQGMYRRLLQKLDPEVRHRCRILIRSGDPLEAESLERVDFAYARSIILISSAKGDRAQRYLSDITLAKVLMSMKALAPDLEEPPNVVVEVASSRNKLLAESVGWKDRTEAVVADDIMGRLFCQAMRFPGISRVYHRLLTDTFGDSLQLKSAQELGLAGKSLRDSVCQLQEGTPIGAMHVGGRQSDLGLLNLDRELQADDLVVLIVSRAQRSVPKGTSVPTRSLPPSRPSTTRRVMVVGWSSHLVSFLVETAAYKHEEHQVTLVWDAELPREKARLQRLQESLPNLKLHFEHGSLAEESELERLQVDSYDKVVLLADHAEEPLVADAENVLRCLLLEGAKPDIVVELNDEDNRPLIKMGQADVLMTGEILSHLLAQVSIHRSLMWIYEELFTKGGAELRLRSPEDGGESYADCQSSALQAGAIAVGCLRQGRVIFNPDPDTQLDSSDRLILVEMEEETLNQ